jgi:transcriptional repressor NrdR
MHCPRCFVNDGSQSRTEVRETRPERTDRQSTGVRRRRQCTICGYRFTTVERPKAPTIRSSKGKVETFDEERLFRSLQRSTAGAEVRDRELREVAEYVRWDLESHRGSVTAANLARLVLGKLPWHRSNARALYRERTPSFENDDETTAGVVEKRRMEDEPIVGPDDRVLEPFDRQKLLASVRLVVHRRIEEDAIADVVSRVEFLVGMVEGPVSTAQIRKWVAEGLRPLDSFAYLRVLSTAPDADPKSLREAVGEIQHGLVRKREGGGLEQFSRARLIARIRRATANRDVVSDGEIEDFADEISEQVRARTAPVESDQIARWVLTWLRQRDPVAFVGFLAQQPLDSPSDLAQALRGHLDQEADSEI